MINHQQAITDLTVAFHCDRAEIAAKRKAAKHRANKMLAHCSPSRRKAIVRISWNLQVRYQRDTDRLCGQWVDACRPHEYALARQRKAEKLAA